MQPLSIDWSRAQNVLCIGAHCDDIEIGCGGTLIELRARGAAKHVNWFVLSGQGSRDAETRSAAAAMLGDDGVVVDVKDFRGSYFPQAFAEIKDAFEDLKRHVQPDLVFTHFLRDRHQDHRLLAELTWNTFRDHLVLEYEIPKFEGDLAQPNVFVPLAEPTVQRKVQTLLRCFPSQEQRAWFDAEVFRGLMRLRGVECHAASGYAEAFHGRKMVL